MLASVKNNLGKLFCIVWFPVNVLAPVPAKLPVAVTPPCHAEPLYILNSFCVVSKYRSPTSRLELGAEEAIR